jgi:Protein of unknown function (DUF2735)
MSCAAAPGEIKMNTNLNHGSAKIYQFPVGGRAAIGGRRPEEIKASAELASRGSEAAFGGAWYHEAAIQESKPTREH